MKFNTKVIHAGIHPDPATGAIMTPIYQTSTYVQEEIGVHKGFEYSRTGNPTRAALESNLAALESGKYGACFGSGLAAIDCVIKMLNPGDEVISTNDLYGGSYRIFKTIFEKHKILYRAPQNPIFRGKCRKNGKFLEYDFLLRFFALRAGIFY